MNGLLQQLIVNMDYTVDINILLLCVHRMENLQKIAWRHLCATDIYI